MLELVDNPAVDISKAEIVEMIGEALPSFRPVETGRNLDQRFLTRN